MSATGVVFGHVNVIAADWRRLSRFYQDVFGCVPVPPERHLSGRAIVTGREEKSQEGGKTGRTSAMFARQTPSRLLAFL